MVKTDFTDSCEWVAPHADHQPTRPVPAWYRKADDSKSAAQGSEIPVLKDMTTIGTGGNRAFYQLDTEAELVAAVREADHSGEKLLILGEAPICFVEKTYLTWWLSRTCAAE